MLRKSECSTSALDLTRPATNARNRLVHAQPNILSKHLYFRGIFEGKSTVNHFRLCLNDIKAQHMLTPLCIAVLDVHVRIVTIKHTQGLQPLFQLRQIFASDKPSDNTPIYLFVGMIDTINKLRTIPSRTPPSTSKVILFIFFWNKSFSKNLRYDVVEQCDLFRIKLVHKPNMTFRWLWTKNTPNTSQSFTIRMVNWQILCQCEKP